MHVCEASNARHPTALYTARAAGPVNILVCIYARLQTEEWTKSIYGVYDSVGLPFEVRMYAQKYAPGSASMLIIHGTLYIHDKIG